MSALAGLGRAVASGSRRAAAGLASRARVGFGKLLRSKLGRKVQGLVRRLRGLPDQQKPQATLTAYQAVFVNYLAFHLFEIIHESYQQKSQGGRDRLGIQWKDLKPKTKEAIPPRPIPGRERGNLTKQQNKTWSAIFARTLGRLRLEMGEDAAKERAARIAWAAVKKQGAVTRLEKFARKRFPILNRSGRLQESVAPGTVVNGRYLPPNADQVFAITSDGKVRVGSRVPYFDRVNKKRTIIPKAGTSANRRLLRLATKRATKSAAEFLQKQL